MYNDTHRFYALAYLIYYDILIKVLVGC